MQEFINLSIDLMDSGKTHWRIIQEAAEKTTAFTLRMAILTIITVLHQLTHQTAQVSQFAKVDFETMFIII